MTATSWHHVDDRVRITKLSMGGFDNNAFVVACALTKQAVIIDAAAEAERHPLRLRRAIPDRHPHHPRAPRSLGAATQVRSGLGIPLGLHSADREIAGIDVDLPFEGDEELAVGELVIHALHTPGHTPGSICFVVEPYVFSGDTLFPGGPGATNFPYSSFEQIMDSLERLFGLPDPTVVYPGHGADTTIGRERPRLAEWRARRW